MYPELKDKAYSLLTEHWNVYEDVNDILDDLLDLGIDQPDSDEVISSYKTEMGIELPKHEEILPKNRGSLEDIFLRVGEFPYAYRPYMEEAKPPDVEKYKEKLKGKPQEKSKEPEGGEKAKKFGFKQDEGVVVLGKRGSGKTNLLRFLVTTLKNFNFFILDAIRNLEDLQDKPNVIDYHRLNPADTKTANEVIGETLDTGNMMVVVDEVDRYKTTPGTKLSDLVNLGRNFDVGYMAAARRTARIDKDVLAGATWTFVFRHILPQDLEVLTDWFGADEQVFRELGDHEVILFRNDQEVWRGTVPLIPAPAHVKPPPEITKSKEKPKEKEPEAKEKSSAPPEAEPETPPEEGPEEPVEKTEEGIRCPDCGSTNTVPLDDEYQICLGCDNKWVPKRLSENFVEGDEKLSKVCPKCGNKNVYWEAGHLHCPRCGWVG